MMVRCAVHGDSLSVLVSPDINESMSRGSLLPYELFVYTLDDAEVMWFVLSKDYLAKAGVSSRVAPLPDDYPEWVMSLHPVCIPCLRAIDASLPPA